jgi:hypothetical protein
MPSYAEGCGSEKHHEQVGHQYGETNERDRSPLFPLLCSAIGGTWPSDGHSICLLSRAVPKILWTGRLFFLGLLGCPATDLSGRSSKLDGCTRPEPRTGCDRRSAQKSQSTGKPEPE